MRPIIAGHRGAAGLAPENTLPAFRRAVELGVRMVELDVRLTRDGVAVCFHDDRLERVTDGTGLLREWDWEPLAGVEVMPGAYRRAFPHTRIPRFSEVLAALPADCRVLVELKPDPEQGDALVDRALEAIAAAEADERCRVISFAPELLRLTRRKQPDLAVGVLATTREGHRLQPLARELRAEAVHAPHALVRAEFVAQVQEGGFLLNAWTVNTAEEICRLAALGVDEITTDFPDLGLTVTASWPQS
ncbi:MAG: glycerophosphoryl diester phosphodiesterase [Armatimonadetes bacterium]|jgi:glycerophosphoryl diester phosphodiesterase|nr:glycerophosphoryl diester phosphodiesterase [Armatimonadota bacterium]